MDVADPQDPAVISISFIFVNFTYVYFVYFFIIIIIITSLLSTKSLIISLGVKKKSRDARVTQF